MVMERNLVKVGNREVKKRYIGNKLIFEDLGDKSEPLSGTEIFTDKADDSVVRVEIDGKSYQHAGSGKNLLNVKTYKGRIDHITGEETLSESSSMILSDFIKVKPNTRYRLSREYSESNSDLGRYFYNKNKEYISGVYGFLNRNSISVNTPVDAEYVKVSYNINDTFIQLEEGSTATAYEPPAPTPDYPIEIHSLNDFDVVSSTGKLSEGQLEEYDYGAEYENINKINLSLDEPLRSVGDVKDRLFRDSDGLWKIERNVGRDLVMGSHLFDEFNVLDHSKEARWRQRTFSSRAKINAISNRFRALSGVTWGVDEVGVLGQAGASSTWFISFRIPSNQSPTTFFNNNPTEVVYELETPTIEILDQELQDKLNNLRSFQDSNYVYAIINDKTGNLSENLKPTLHTTFKSKGWYDYYLKTLLK